LLAESKFGANVVGGGISLVVIIILTEFEKNCSTFYHPINPHYFGEGLYPSLFENDSCGGVFEGFFYAVKVEC
jgi:hypothetical protein